MHAGSAATGSSEPSTEPAAVDPAQRQPTPDRESELQLVLETADFAEVVTAEHTCSDDESSNLTSTGE